MCVCASQYLWHESGLEILYAENYNPVAGMQDMHDRSIFAFREHISFWRYLKVVTVMIKSMTFRRFSESGLLLMMGKGFFSLTPCYLLHCIITTTKCCYSK